jgi:hypothetical protein
MIQIINNGTLMSEDDSEKYLDDLFENRFITADDSPRYVFVPRRFLCRIDGIGPYLRPEVCERLEALFGGKQGERFILIQSDNTPAPTRDLTDRCLGSDGSSLQIEDEPLGDFGDWQNCNWLFTFSEEDRIAAKLFLSGEP